MTFAFQLSTFTLVQGVLSGLSYGLLAMGLVLVYKSNRIVNFAHAQIGVVAAVLFQKLVKDHHLPYWPSLVLILLIGTAIGAVCEFLLRRLFNRPRLLVMVATIGVSQLLLYLSFLPIVSAKLSSYPVPFSFSRRIGSFVLGPSDVLILVIAPVVAIALGIFFSRSPYGLAIRAAAENAESARIAGIRVRRASTGAWMLAGLLSTVTAVLLSPRQGRTFGEALGPTLLVIALTAALIGGMTNLRVAFGAGIVLGIVEQIGYANYPTHGTVTLIMFTLLIVALLVRGRVLRVGTRDEERSSWQLASAARLPTLGQTRRRAGRVATVALVGTFLLLPAVLSNSQAFLFSRIFVYGVITLSLTVLSGWAGQLSLGQFGLVAVGAVLVAHVGRSFPFLLLFPVAAVAGALVAVVVGLPALRIRGLYLAVTTLGFAVLVSSWLLQNRHIGLPGEVSVLVTRPRQLGVDFAPQRVWYLAMLALLIAAVAVTTNLRRSNVGRALLAVRDNEAAAGALGIPVIRTKLLAFALSGAMAGVAGVALAFTQQRFSDQTFPATESLLIVSMVVIGGMGSIRGALLGAGYVVGLPAIFGSGLTVTLLTSGVGLLVFLLYLPGGLVGVLDRGGDVVANMIDARRRDVRADVVASAVIAS
jgi:ABC-type branched-subunit amino acid transport system permease subunit